MTSGSLDDTQLPELGGSQEERVARRVAELFDSDAQFRAAAPVPEVIEAVCTPGLRLTEVFETIVEGYADRPALGQRARELVTDAGTGRTSVRLLPQFDTISYREFWDRVCAIASAWRHDPAHPATAGDLVATVGFASADYLVVEMVCAYLGLVDSSAAAQRSGIAIAADHRGVPTQDRRRQCGVPRSGGRVCAEQSVGGPVDGVRLPARS